MAENDFACTAINKYRKLIKDYPTSPEVSKAKKDLAEIYKDALIDFKPCRKNVGGTTATDPAKCRRFQQDALELAFYYYTQIGEQNKIKDIYGGKAGEDFLDDEGIAIKLLRAITLEEEKPTIKFKVSDSGGGQNELTAELNDILSISDNGKVNYKGDENYVWRIDTVNPSSVTARLYKIEQKPGKETKYTAVNVPHVTLKLNVRTPIRSSFSELNAQGQPTTPEKVVDVTLTKVDSKREAYVTILPGAGRGFTTSSFRINIPVDPRPFKWTPEQLQSQIDKTRELIEDFNKVIDKLDKVISTMKKLCLGMFAFLTVKNSFTGVRNIARREVS